MKTVEHSGYTYQIGAVYEFTDSDRGDHWELGVLSDYTNGEDGVGFQRRDGNKTEWFRYIRLQQAPTGTIIKTPVKLVHGKCYSIDIDAFRTEGVTAIYRDSCGGVSTFACKFGLVNEEQVTNIKPLTVSKG